MENKLALGESRFHEYKVKPTDFAEFDAGTVHEVMSTFALAREMEWVSRLFAIDIKQADEEGIGTMLEINHVSPALPGAKLSLKATVSELNNHELICNIEVRQGERLIATGRTGQKILKKDKLKQIFTSLER